MFSPIRKIFTYIQKNASSSPIFGNSNTVNEDMDSQSTEPTAQPSISNSKSMASKQYATMNDKNPQTSAQSRACINTMPRRLSPIEVSDDDDIESHIRPIIIKQSSSPFKNNSPSRPHVPWSNHPRRRSYVEPIIEIIPRRNPVELDDELGDFAVEPIVSIHEEANVDFEYQDDNIVAVGSDYETVAVASDDEIIALDANDSVGEFEQIIDLGDVGNSNEVIICEAELNTSVVSDTVAEDPLAIDDCTVPNLKVSDTSDHIVWLDNEAGQEQQASGSGKIKQRRLTEVGTPTKKKQPKTTSDVPATAATNKESEASDELRSDGGSDSGLGSETSALQTTLTGLNDGNGCSSAVATPNHSPTKATKARQQQSKSTAKTSAKAKQPLRSNLKRRLDDDSTVVDSLVNDLTSDSGTQHKRPKRSINFDSVKVYYFPRQQGFSCVPTAGGCTLGMGARHIAFKTLTLAEHAAELRRAHRMQLQEVQPRGSSSDDSEESEEDYLSDGSSSDQDGESNGFLQPVSPKQRRALLKAAGVRKIDASEKADCKNIRNSREVCGCTCREFCDPETCSCSKDGIKCQVDRAMFPCGCTREACLNIVGRVEFNPNRVRTHYIHTIMRLDMEQRQQQNPTNLNYTLSAAPSSSNFFNMQPQSNYSSGYASPAYTSDVASSNFYQQQQQPQTNQQMDNGRGTYSALSPYPLTDIMEANLYTGNGIATPAYGEIMSTSTPASATYLNYGAYPQASTISLYHTQSAGTPPTATLMNSVGGGGYSSCAVPMVPPIGNATTTTASAQYHHASTIETTATAGTGSSSYLPTVTNPTTDVVDGGCCINSNFIDLTTPLTSSTRITQLQDILQHSRNVSNAIMSLPASTNISVMSYASASASANSCNSNVTTINISDLSNSNSSLETPTIEDAQKNCMTFEVLPTPLCNPTPIVGIVANEAISTSASASNSAISVTNTKRKTTVPAATTTKMTTSVIEL